MVGGVAVAVAGALPHTYCSQMRRLQSGDLPLVHGHVRDPVEPDLAVTPRLISGPLDALVEILALPRGERVEVTGRPSGTTHVNPDTHVPIRDPLLGVRQLVHLVLPAGPLQDIGMIADHLLPFVGHQLFEGEPLAVGAVAGDDRVTAGRGWPEDIGAQHEAVAYLDRHVPLDRHRTDLVDTKRFLGGRIVRHGRDSFGRRSVVPGADPVELDRLAALGIGSPRHASAGFRRRWRRRAPGIRRSCERTRPCAGCPGRAARR